MQKKTSKLNKKTKVIDLFCWVGGLTHGFVREGFDVVAGIDFEESCRYWYESNNKWAKFFWMDIKDVDSKWLLDKYWKNCDIKILVWCAPCQPFSLMNTQKSLYFNNADVEKKSPIRKFADLIEQTQPEIVSMENVAGLMDIKKYPSFKYFLDILEKNWYWKPFYKVVNCVKYGIPQTRRRLVLLASKLWPIELIPETHKTPTTVRDVIGNLPAIKDGEISNFDSLHRSRKLNDLNRKRIKAMPKNGWDLRDIDPKFLPECHRKKSWKTYLANVYARMRRDLPAPTMTTRCTWFWNGRFGHPEQNRAISLREASLFQTFPEYYKFFDEKDWGIAIQKISKHIGNAVPVILGQVIAKSIQEHLNKYL